MITSEADISDCGCYRWSLTRIWNEDQPPLVCIGLNPSTADAPKDDPTIRRCIGFSRRNGNGGIVMINLFAFRSTDSKVLRELEDPVGIKNDHTIRFFSENNRTILAWGNETSFMRSRVAAVIGMLRRPLFCLGKTKNGSPRHPLYVLGSKEFERLT